MNFGLTAHRWAPDLVPSASRERVLEVIPRGCGHAATLPLEVLRIFVHERNALISSSKLA